MRLQDLNWMDVERYLQQDDRIILITGATEQHAYLSLTTDVLIPARLALGAAERERVLIAPPLNFGVSEEFVDFPGTITLSPTVFDLVLSEVVEGLMHQGFRRFFILNGHGGNRQPSRLTDLHMDGEIRVNWYDWWHSDVVREYAESQGLEIDHANWGENFPFTRVAESPQEVKTPVNLALIDTGENPRAVLGDGNYGGPYQVDDAVMMAMFDLMVEDVVEQLRLLHDA